MGIYYTIRVLTVTRTVFMVLTNPRYTALKSQVLHFSKVSFRVQKLGDRVTIITVICHRTCPSGAFVNLCSLGNQFGDLHTVREIY